MKAWSEFIAEMILILLGVVMGYMIIFRVIPWFFNTWGEAIAETLIK